MLGMYVHIPFCRQKCLYCDFPSFAGLEGNYEEYVNALCVEISHQGLNFSGNTVDTVYIGGGTPSILPAGEITKILLEIKRSFALCEQAEISIEANPGTVDFKKLKAYREAGINRISFGIQSLDNGLLAKIGRIHTASDAVEAVRQAHQAGFENINVDLMYGLPGQEVQDLFATFSAVLALPITHISVYGLMIEENTKFGELYDQGALTVPDDDAVSDMYDLMCSFWPSHGFPRYEVSNFSRSGFTCKHNLKYWQYAEYLGVGSASCSFINEQRKTNVADVADYVARMKGNQSPVLYAENPDISIRMAEYIFLGLRTVKGVNLSEFKEIFGHDLVRHYSSVIGDLARQKLICIAGEYLFLTPLGMKFGNRAFRAFLP